MLPKIPETRVYGLCGFSIVHRLNVDRSVLLCLLLDRRQPKGYRRGGGDVGRVPRVRHHRHVGERRLSAVKIGVMLSYLRMQAQSQSCMCL